MKSELADATLASVDENAPFTLETDASDVAVSAVQQQNGRPVAFWSRTLNSNKKRYANVEKEAAAIVEAVRRWSHHLLPRKFIIITDQNSVAFMLGNSRRNEIPFSTLERPGSGLHDLLGTNDSDNQPDLQTPLNWRSSRQRRPPDRLEYN